MARFLFFTSSVKGHIAKGTSKGRPLFAKRSTGLFCKFIPLRSALRYRKFRALHSATKDRKPFEKGLTENFCGQLPLDLT